MSKDEHRIRRTLLGMDEETIESFELRSIKSKSKPNYLVISPIDPIDGIPFGMELLVDTCRIFVRPQETPEYDFMSLGNLSHYDIIDLDSGKIYFAWESNVRGFGKQRQYNLKIVDFAARPVLQVTNHSTCLSSCLRIINCVGSTGGLVKVNKPDGTKVAQLVQKYNGWTPKFAMTTTFGEPAIYVYGPKGAFACCNQCGSSWLINSAFLIRNQEGEKIGSFLRGSSDHFERDDTFGLIFPQDLKVEKKAGLLGSIFAVNSMIFDRREAYSSRQNAVEVYEERELEERRLRRANAYKSDLDYLNLDDQGYAKKSPSKGTSKVRRN